MSSAVGSAVLTREQYVDSLRTGREVWIDGERFADVTAHPAFRNATRSLARIQDAMHERPERDPLIGENRGGIVTHRIFIPSYGSAERLAGSNAIAV